jgi:hypothetical protein
LADIEMPVVRLLEIEEGFGRHPHAGGSTTASIRHPPLTPPRAFPTTLTDNAIATFSSILAASRFAGMLGTEKREI